MANEPTTRQTLTAALRAELMDAIERVKTGKMKPDAAGAIAQLSGQVLTAARLELDVMKFRAKLGPDAESGRSRIAVD